MKKRYLAIASLIMVMMFVVGCGKGESAEQVVTNALNAVKNGDKESVYQYFDYGTLIQNGNHETSAETEEMAKLVFAKLEYKIISATEDDNKATVEVEITNTDMGLIFKDFMNGLFAIAFSGLSEEEMNTQSMEIFTELLARDDNPTVTKKVKIELEKIEDSWKITLSDDLSNALLGGMYTASNMMGAGNDGSTAARKLQEINNWLIGKIWNEGFCDITHYVNRGTNSVGSTMDIEFTLQLLNKAMESKPEYDAYMNALDEVEYADVKMIWGKLSGEIDILYEQLQTTPPVANDSSTRIDTGKFSQYQNAFDDATEAVK